MSRIVVAAAGTSKEDTLNSLRQWGLLHILPLQTPENEQVTVAKAAFANAQRVLEALPVKATAENIDKHELLSKISEVLQNKKEAEEALATSSAELKNLEPFGDFDPHSIRDLSKRDIHIKLYRAEEKAYKEVKNLIVQEFKRVKNEVFFAVFSKSHIDLPYTEITLPLKSVQELKEDRDNAEKNIAECNKKLAAYASKRKDVGELVLQASDELAFEAASAGMHSEIGVCFIQGYCPKEKLTSLSELAAKNGWGVSVHEPSADETVPTLLKHQKAVKPIDALYNIIGITPGYREIDVSSAFLFFFSIFFAMIVGDTAYGLLFMGITFFASKKFKDAPRYSFHFLYLMSGCTIVWGFLNANYLGLSNEFVPAVIDICKAAWAPEALKNIAAWVRVDDNVKYLCFVLAIIHLSIAHVWNAWVNRASVAAVISKTGWFCTTWMMFFLTCNMILGHAFPQFALYAGIAGVVLIVIGAVMQAEWFSIGMLPLNLVSNLVDVISYIRLFAVGMAGYSVANAFNGMVAPLLGSIPGAVSAALILLLVHALNIALAVMGVAVHAVRLNTLEFSNNVGVEWSGNPYTPFKKSI
jgi:V/A-type H+-transporting ATPase subunit I